MIFDRIVISNLFSYYGEQVFDLSGATQDKNIIIIHGRNGHGKTNFLNCLKLLFIGSEDPSIRTVGISSSEINARLASKNYINGFSPFWEGIRNSLAMKQGLKEYFVKVEWFENDNRIIAVRSWPLNLNHLSGELEITIGTDKITGDDATSFLENRLPCDLVPYFYFDGERIRELAEASERRQLTSHIERLLDLRKIIDLRDQCVHVLNDLRKQYASNDLIQRELDFEAKQYNFIAERNRFLQQKESLELDVQQFELSLAKITKELDRIFESGSRFDEESLRQQQKNTKLKLEELCHRFISVGIPTSPLSVNIDLLNRSLARLGEMLHDDGLEQRQLLDRFSRILPEELFGLPPHSSPRLSNSQERFYREKLNIFFAKMTKGFNHEQFFKLSIDKLQELYETLSRNVRSAEGYRFQAAEILMNIGRERRELNRIERELLNAGGLSRQERERYEQIKEERIVLESKRSDAQSKVDQLNREIQRIDKDLESLEHNLRKTRNDIERASRGKSRVTLLEKCIKAFDAYRKSMREKRRAEIEARMNNNFGNLMDSSAIVAKIILDESFIPQYVDKSNRNVGRFSISAGTKQLLATALLWALKDVSNRPFPVIVDTPLARIDRRHQENLLKLFYPKVSEQVIILPTDSELDTEKLKLIEKYVYKEFILDNPTGISTVVTPAN